MRAISHSITSIFNNHSVSERCDDPYCMLERINVLKDVR